MQSARFLKVLVVVLGVAIVVALGFVIYGFVRLSTGTEQSSSGVAMPSGSPTVNDLGQPAGSKISEITSLGNTRLAVLVTGGELPDRIVIFDLKSGRVVGTTFVSPGP